MKAKLLLIVCAVFFMSSVQAQELNYERGELLVQLTKDQSLLDISSEFGDVQIQDSKLISKTLNIWKLVFNDNVITEQQAISEMYRHADVQVAQLNHKVSLRIDPNDAQFGSQWQYFQANDKDIDAPEAWDISTGGMTMNGDEIVVGVVDNGYNLNHEDLVDNIWINTEEIAGNGIDDDANGYIDDVNGWNAYNSNGNVTSAGHGTAVAGIVGAKGDNGIGVTGVNWDVKVMTIQGSSGNEGTVLEAYNYILDSRIAYNTSGGTEGSFVVATNASFGIDFGQPEDSPLWCDMYDTLGQNGILSCGATINGNFDVDDVGDVPTACPSEYLIAVTNTNINDEKVTSAGYGLTTIDLGAPGAGTFTVSQSGYGGFGGTSGATPHVTGTIALMYSSPCQQLADLAMSDPELTVQLIRDFILDNVDPNTSLEGITVTGGRLNVNNAMVSLNEACNTLAVLDLDTEGTIVLYPNPASELLNIQTQNNQKIETVQIFDLTGKMISNKQDVQSNAIGISELTPGAYIVSVKFEDSDAPFNKMFIKR